MILAIDDKATPEVQSAAWRGIDEIAKDLEALPEVNSYELATRFRFADGQVTFRWRDSADGNKQKLLPLSVNEFLTRFLLHILPQGFVRIRNFGFLANRRRSTLLPLCFHLLGTTRQPPAEEHSSSTEDAPDLYRCPKCGGPMKVIERLTAAEILLRSPPEVTAAA